MHSNLLCSTGDTDDMYANDGSVARYMLCNVSKRLGGMSKAHCDGCIVLDNGVEVKVRILLDTGAVCANYVSLDVVDKIRNEVNIKKLKGGAMLADTKTTLDSSESVELNLLIMDDDQNQQQFHGVFESIGIAEGHIIIGLPSILGKLWDFTKALWDRRVDCKINNNESVYGWSHLSNIEELLRPWEHDSQIETPEEAEVDHLLNLNMRPIS